MMELTYSYYQEVFLGTKIPETEFIQLKSHSEEILRHFVRNQSFESLDEEKVKQTLCRICECLYETKGQGAFLRESLDGYDVTYDKQGMSKRITQIIRRNFGDEGVLYRGRRK